MRWLILCSALVLFACPPPEDIPEELCGNGVLDGGEDCDDGDAEDLDGCSSLCLVDPGFFFETAPPGQGGIPDALTENDRGVIIHASLDGGQDTYTLNTGPLSPFRLIVLGAETTGLCNIQAELTVSSGQVDINELSGDIPDCFDVSFFLDEQDTVTISISGEEIFGSADYVMILL